MRNCLDDSHHHVRCAAVKALAALAPSGSVNVEQAAFREGVIGLAAVTSSPDLLLQQAVVDALADFSERDDPDAEVRIAAMDAFASVVEKSNVRLMNLRIRRLSDCEATVMLSALGSLMEPGTLVVVKSTTINGDKRVLLELIRRIRDADREVRMRSLPAIAELAAGDDRLAVDAASMCVGDVDMNVRRAAIQSLLQLSAKGDGLALKALMLRFRALESGARSTGVEALGHLAEKGNDAVISAMNILLEDRVVQMRVAALEVLAHVAERGDFHCIGRVYACTADGDADVRRSAFKTMRVLAPKGDEHVASLAYECMHSDPNAFVRRAAEDAFVALHYPVV